MYVDTVLFMVYYIHGLNSSANKFFGYKNYAGFKIDNKKIHLKWFGRKIR